MIIKLIKRICVVLSIIAAFPLSGWSQEQSEEVIHFRASRDVVDSGYMNNKVVLDRMNDLLSDPSVILKIDSITIVSTASLEGSVALNKALSKKRGIATKGYLMWKYPYLVRDRIIVSSIGEDWDSFREKVANDPNVPDRANVLDILNSGVSTDVMKARLMASSAGSYINKNILPYLRTSTVCVVWFKEEMPVVVELPEEVVEVVEYAESEPILTPVVPVVPVVPFVPAVAPCSTSVALKTNVALLAATVANLGMEIGFCNHFSIDIPFMYSPYTVKSDYMLRVIAVQPEFRYWLKDSMKGHFFGFHGHLGWFNVATNNDYRYQSAGQNMESPLWGFGLSYGYALPLSNHWGLEFTVGGGYANIHYDRFYNVPNGAKIDSGTKHYWGLTRAGITLSYRFNK